MTNMMYKVLDFLDREFMIKIAGQITLWTGNPTAPRYPFRYSAV